MEIEGSDNYGNLSTKSPFINTQHNINTSHMVLISIQFHKKFDYIYILILLTEKDITKNYKISFVWNSYIVDKLVTY